MFKKLPLFEQNIGLYMYGKISKLVDFMYVDGTHGS